MSSASSLSAHPKKIIIAGGGVIGVSTAYYLALQHTEQQQQQQQDKPTPNTTLSITIVDPTGQIAPAASGKAGGFLALDWNDHSPLGPLARRSFQLHEQLANGDINHNEASDIIGPITADEIMYRKLTCASISVRPMGKRGGGIGRKPSGKKLQGVEWVQQEQQPSSRTITSTTSSTPIIAKNAMEVIGFQSLGDERTIAQVHPKLLCDALWKRVQHQFPNVNAELVQGSVMDTVYDTIDDNDTISPDSKLVGVKVVKKQTSATKDDNETTIIPADTVLFACGPWTTQFYKEHNLILQGTKYHSVLLQSQRTLCQSVFFDGCGDPEVYPRPDGTVYCTGFPDTPVIVKETPGQEEVRDEKVAQIVNSVRDASGTVGNFDDDGSGDGILLNQEPKVTQSCYLPTTPDGLPVMGEIPNKKHCFVAAGHGCWGILLGPATGEVMASLMLDEDDSRGKKLLVDIQAFRPERFRNMIF